MSHTYQLPEPYCHTNGPLRWLPSRLVDHYLLLLLRRAQQSSSGTSSISSGRNSSSSSSSTSSSSTSSTSICCCNTRYLQSAAALPAAATSPAIDLSSERSKNKASDRLGGESHTTAAVLTLGSTTRTKVHIAATFGQKMLPVWANFTKF